MKNISSVNILVKNVLSGNWQTSPGERETPEPSGRENPENFGSGKSGGRRDRTPKGTQRQTQADSCRSGF